MELMLQMVLVFFAFVAMTNIILGVLRLFLFQWGGAFKSSVIVCMIGIGFMCLDNISLSLVGKRVVDTVNTEGVTGEGL